MRQMGGLKDRQKERKEGPKEASQRRTDGHADIQIGSKKDRRKGRRRKGR